MLGCSSFNGEMNLPSKSKSQHLLMEAVAHNPKFAAKAGIAQSVGKEFTDADKNKFEPKNSRRAELKKRMYGKD